MSGIDDARKKVFLTELHQLVEEDYITGKQFNEIARAYHQYYADFHFKRDRQEEVQQTTQGKVKSPKMQSSSVVTPSKTKLQKKKLTVEEQKERNITWSLNFGVILLLIGGLFVATSNWATMANWMKSGLIGLVSLLFFGLSLFATKVLKIEKTGLAFIILGSLFLPIFLLSIGWFKLLGEYLSFTGEGRFLFGLLSSLVVAPIYINIARRLSSRLFVWLSYLACTISMIFFISLFKLDRDWFYFGFMLINVLIVCIFHRLKKQESLKLFTNELVAFAQIQLILSSLVTMVFYQNEVVNGINLFITGTVYLAMVYVSGRKEYHFVFSVMIVYGAYQLIEHSVLEHFQDVLFVLVGIGFLIVPKFLDDQHQWKRIFQFTSAVVSMLAFVYISLDAFFTNMLEEPSMALVLSYFLLAGQFLYLANRMNVLLLNYLSPIFLVASIYELVGIMESLMGIFDSALPLFIIGFGLYLLVGFVLRLPLFSTIRKSSRDVGMMVMGGVSLLTLLNNDFLKLGIMLILLSIPLYFCTIAEERIGYKAIARWLLPVSVAGAFSAFGEELRLSNYFYHLHFGIAMNAVIGSLVSFLGYFGWKKFKNEALARTSLFIGQIFYTSAILFALSFHINELLVRPLILIGGIGVYLAFYRVTKYQWLPYIISIMSLLSYFSILQSIYTKLAVPPNFIYFENTFAAVILLVVSYLLRKRSVGVANGFAWVGHVYLPGALLVSFIIFGERSYGSFILALILYFVSAYLVNQDWKSKTFLYGGFTAMYLSVFTGMMHFHVRFELTYAFFITSLFVACYGLMAATRFRQYTKYYLVPFSIIGIAAFIGSYPFTLTLYFVALLYSVGLIFYLNHVKWKLLSIIPLLLFFAGTLQYLQQATIFAEGKVLLLCLFGVLLLIIGRLVYRQFHVVDEKGSVLQLDGYTVTAFLFFGSAYLFLTEEFWLKFIPGLLVSVGLWLQISRIPAHSRVWVKLAAGIYLLEPYYSTILELNLPKLFEREIFVLPLVVAVIYLQRCFAGKYQRVTTRIHWAILIFVSLALIQDGLESSTVYDAIILGTLSLVSMLSGMLLKVKSYFLVGSGVLLLNVFLQTRPLWGNMPWWVYLLIAGSILISVASYNEWHKQKTAKGERTTLTILKNKLVSWYKKWN